MLKKVGLGIAAVLVVFLIYVGMKSPNYVVSREVMIHAPAAKIFPHINNAKLMDAWSPWSKIDPEAKMAFSGPEEGVGSRTSWTAGKQLGTGSATVIESVPNERVVTKLEYLKPYEMSQEADLTIRPTEGGSVVTLSVRGQNNFMGRVMCSFMNMDKMVGGTFETGLASLKAAVETGSK